MIETDYLLQPTCQDRIRVSFLREKRWVVNFCVQYEAIILGQWKPIVRYDTAHGFPHVDILHPDGTSDKRELSLNYNEALTYAIADVMSNWESYRRRYEEAMKK